MIEQTFIKELQQLAGDDFANKRYLLAVSGGVDSMVLCHLFMQHKLNFSIAHCNFQLRGEESNQDEIFVKEFAKNNAIEIFVKQFETEKIIEQEGGSTQQVARKLRYDWFHELLPNFDFLVTAHHSDDNIETFFINLSRGTGLKGLMGIPSENEKIIRPLLKITKTKILEYAEKQNISWREDSSNQSDKYTRNFYRNQVIPMFKEHKHEFNKVMSKNLELLGKTHQLLHYFLKDFKKDAVKVTKHQTRIALDKVKQVPLKEVVLYELISPFGFNYDQVEGMLGVVESGKVFANKQYKAIIHKAELIIEKNTPNPSYKVFEVYNNFDELSQSEFFSVDILEKPKLSELDFNKNTLYLPIFKNFEKEFFPVHLRNATPKDRFVPFGANYAKNVFDFLKNEGLSLFDRKNSLVLISKDDKNLWWVVGYRAANMKVNDDTKKVLKLVTK